MVQFPYPSDTNLDDGQTHRILVTVERTLIHIKVDHHQGRAPYAYVLLLHFKACYALLGFTCTLHT